MKACTFPQIHHISTILLKIIFSPFSSRSTFLSINITQTIFPPFLDPGLPNWVFSCCAPRRAPPSTSRSCLTQETSALHTPDFTTLALFSSNSSETAQPSSNSVKIPRPGCKPSPAWGRDRLDASTYNDNIYHFTHLARGRL